MEHPSNPASNAARCLARADLLLLAIGASPVRSLVNMVEHALQ